MNRKVLLAAGLAAAFLTTSCAGRTAQQQNTLPTIVPIETIDAVDFYDLPQGYSPFEDPYSETEPPLSVNLTAVQNFASAWNMALTNAESLQLDPSNAVVRPTEGMLEGGQVFEFAYPAGTLYLYTLEGRVVGARLEAHTNAWAGTEARREWSVLWKAMIEAVNGNGASSRHSELITRISKGFPPAGQEETTLVGEVVNDSGWVYQMVDEDLGYEYVKEVTCWVAALAGAAGRLIPEVGE